MKTNAYIFVTFQREGFHCYPDASEEVAFLRQTHRHMFHVRVQLSVSHNEREVEFFMLRNRLVNAMPSGSFDSKSCETICHDIYKSMTAFDILPDLEQRHVIITVSEDGECGATVEFGEIE